MFPRSQGRGGRREEGGLDRSKTDGMHGFEQVVLEVVVDVFVKSAMKPASTNLIKRWNAMKEWIVEGHWEEFRGQIRKMQGNQEESRFGASVRHEKTLERTEAKEEEEDIEWRTDVERNTTLQEEGSDMDPAQVHHGEEREMHNMTRYMVKTPASDRGQQASSQPRLFELLACVNTMF